MKLDDDRKIIKHLKHMPVIKDDQNKEILFQHITSKYNSRGVKSRKLSKLIPILSIPFIIIAIFMILPQFIKQDIPSMHIGKSTEEMTSIEHALDESNAKITAFDSAGEDKWGENEHNSSHVIQELKDHAQIVYGAVFDEKFQTIIPLSIIVPDTNDLDMYYNQIEGFLNEPRFGAFHYLFKGAVIENVIPGQKVLIELPENFMADNEMLQLNILEELLTIMFRPHQINIVILEHKDINSNDKKVMEFQLQKATNVHFKLYKDPGNNQSFLVPVKLKNKITIEEAITNLKTSQKECNIYQTIPDDVQFTIHSSEKELIIRFGETKNLYGEKEMMLMIESILMTAKNFNYEFVKFIGMPFQRIGPYQLSEAIPVPIAINPVNLINAIN